MAHTHSHAAMRQDSSAPAAFPYNTGVAVTTTNSASTRAAFLQRHGPLGLYALLVVAAAGLRLGGLTQVPHTLWVDEAWFGLQGRLVLTGADLLPLRPPGLGIGDSAFQIYAAALVQAVGLPITYSSRMASAVTGTLMVAALYPVLLGLFRSLHSERAAQLAALIGGALVATHFSALLHSRGGLQMSGAALAAILVTGGLYRTFSRMSWRWAVLTGVLAGLGQTTYEAALGLPVLIVVYTAARWAWPGSAARRQVLLLGGLTLAAGVAAFAPMLVFYFNHPGIYLAHVGQTQAVAGSGGLLAALGRVLTGLWQVGWGISIAGDPLPGRNVIGRPLFDPLASVLVWLGIGWTLWRWRRQPAAQLLLAWVAVMALPSALSDDAPAFSRMLPMLPALAGLAGLGALTVLQWAAPHGAPVRALAASLLGLALALSAALSVRAYFVEWTRQPGFFDALHAGARRTAEAALAFSPAAAVFVMPGSHPLVAAPFELLLDPTPVQRFDPAGCLPHADHAPRDVVYGVIQVMDDRTLPALQAAYPAGEPAGAVMHPDGYAYAAFYRVPAGTPAPAPEHALNVEFANGVRLTGFSAAPSAAPGESVTVRLHWQAVRSAPQAVTGFVHVGRGRDSQPLIAQHDGALCAGFAPPRWAPGYVYIEDRALTVAPETAPGLYDLRVGLYDPASGARYTIVAADVLVEDDRARLAAFEVR